MTSVTFFRKDGLFVAVEAIGHTGYAEEGEDIVCASVSSIIQTAVLGLMQAAGINVDYEVDEKTPKLSAKLPTTITEQEKHDADLILKTAYLGVSDLYQEYSDFIKLEVK
ncbi:MAG: ribosomal-processing cysteine protease Prp [Clostridia bacterium]|nr:ribosomal-processing cysteine protease Prp [Clostridia bacterium]